MRYQNLLLFILRVENLENILRVAVSESGKRQKHDSDVCVCVFELVLFIYNWVCS